MPLHLTKVAVGCASVEALQNRIARRVSGGVVRVPTRMRPKRMAELVGGSLHWIVKHRIVARQEYCGSRIEATAGSILFAPPNSSPCPPSPSERIRDGVTWMTQMRRGARMTGRGSAIFPHAFTASWRRFPSFRPSGV
jgi:hypothetical protein